MSMYIELHCFYNYSIVIIRINLKINNVFFFFDLTVKILIIMYQVFLSFYKWSVENNSHVKHIHDKGRDYFFFWMYSFCLIRVWVLETLNPRWFLGTYLRQTVISVFRPQYFKYALLTVLFCHCFCLSPTQDKKLCLINNTDNNSLLFLWEGRTVLQKYTVYSSIPTILYDHKKHVWKKNLFTWHTEYGIGSSEEECTCP